MNIGCGPAIEVRRFLSDLPEGLTCDFTLMDFNEETLGYVKDCLAEIEPSWRGRAQVRLLHESVHNLLKAQSGTTERTGQFDLVYCSGLFDYLSDKICSRLLRLFYSWLAPDGVLFVTNMHTSNPERRIMDLIMEWYLIYRDEVAMANLVPGLGEQRVFCDQTGVNVALEIRKI
jgi:extracellular factor (EF) 3-hydroxypalmitic acid methyl ester biosynthesis protein